MLLVGGHSSDKFVLIFVIYDTLCIEDLLKHFVFHTIERNKKHVTYYKSSGLYYNNIYEKIKNGFKIFSNVRLNS